jgi:hypothetical protein
MFSTREFGVDARMFIAASTVSLSDSEIYVLFVQLVGVRALKHR